MEIKYCADCDKLVFITEDGFCSCGKFLGTLLKAPEWSIKK